MHVASMVTYSRPMIRNSGYELVGELELSILYHQLSRLLNRWHDEHFIERYETLVSDLFDIKNSIEKCIRFYCQLWSIPSILRA